MRLPCLSLFSLLLLFTSAQLLAQKGVLTGSLTDTTGKTTIPYATITVFNAGDTSIITYRLSDEAGKFRVPNLPLDKDLRVVITATGYDVWRKEFSLSSASPSLHLGSISMQSDIAELEEILVIAERPPVVFRKDTIEFNAAAFKTLPTALVEDLLKKLPGVEVDREGNIVVNGRRVNRMLVDGKEFFGSDPKIASKNLPANLIDKVQVTDDREERLRNPDAAAGDIGQIINLKLKRSVKQGWFGKVYAGTGTQKRHEIGGIVNMFRDTLQVSVLGYGNNLNRSGFSIQDVMNIGGFNRSNINSVSVTSGGGFALNDISFGGMGFSGIDKSTGGGININTLLGKRTTVSTQYFYGRNSNYNEQKIFSQQFFNDTTFTSQTKNAGNIYSESHRISAYVKTKLDTLNSSIEYRPSFIFTNGSRDNESGISTSNNYEALLNESINKVNSNNNGFAMDHALSLQLNFKKKGRTLYSSLNMQLNRRNQDQYNNVENIFHKLSSTTLLQQLRITDNNNLNGRFFANYSEPLTKKLTLRFNQSVDLFNTKEYINTIDYDPVSGNFILPNEDFTNGIQRKGLRSNTFTGINIKIKQISLTTGVNYQLLNIHNTFLKNEALRQNFFFILPSTTVNWKKWNFSYNIGASEPAVSNLQPTVNNTNPLYIQTGNPNLKPTLTHRISTYSNTHIMKRSMNLNFNSNISLSQHAVIQARSIDENGVQTTKPINVNGIWQAYANGGFSKLYQHSTKWKSTLGASIALQYSSGLMQLNTVRSGTANYTVNPGMSASLIWNDKIEFHQRYRPSWTKSTYESAAYTELNFWRHSATTDLVIRVPKRIVWESSLDYSYNPQVAEGMQKNIYRWNAAVNVLFLKEDKGQLKLSVFDILNQNNSVSRSIRENFIQDNETLVLKRYFLVTFTYNIRSFSSGKVGGRNNLLLF